jgi:uncharacterized protein YegP (UPF0339 family)
MPYQFELFTDDTGAWRWRFRAHSDEILAEGSESYATKKDCEDGVKVVREKAASANVVIFLVDE